MCTGNITDIISFIKNITGIWNSINSAARLGVMMAFAYSSIPIPRQQKRNAIIKDRYVCDILLFKFPIDFLFSYFNVILNSTGSL